MTYTNVPNSKKFDIDAQIISLTFDISSKYFLGYLAFRKTNYC